MAESSFASAGPEAPAWGSVGLVVGEDGKFSVPSELKAGPISPRVQALLNLVDLTVAAHNARVDEVAELKRKRGATAETVADERSSRVVRKLGASASGTFVHSAGPSGVVESQDSESYMPTDADSVPLGFGSDSNVPCC